MWQEKLVRGIIVVLGAAAVVLAVEILDGSAFDQTAAKTIQTALALAIITPLAAAGLNLAKQRSELVVLGRLAAVVSLIAFVVVAIRVWTNDFFLFGDWRPALYAFLVAIAVAQVTVLLTIARRHDPNWVRFLRAATIVALGILVALAIKEIASPSYDQDFKESAIAAVAYGFGMISLVLFGTLTREPRQQHPGSG
jgi:phosphoglycerol transferase MdoB-like AlkP superfamily enzyme